MTKKILWVVAAIDGLGGGERLLFEGLDFFEKSNIDVQVVTWKFNRSEKFNGDYNTDNINVLHSSAESRANIFKYSLNRAKTLFQLFKLARRYNPDLILCQSEYDAIFAGALSVLLRKQYGVLIFGQTYQFPWDMMKYTYLFKKHLEEIVNSSKGYKDTIPLSTPKMGFFNRLMIELLSVLRVYFIKKAENTYTLSTQVQWETEKIYSVKPKIIRAGFSVDKLKERMDTFSRKSKNEVTKFVMLSRLVKKKRTDLVIKAFKDLKIDATLTIMGGGEEFDNLSLLVKDLDLSEKVMLTGRVSDEVLHKNLAESDVFISMDIADFDITVVEAMSFGLYVLVSTDYVIDSELERYKAIDSVEATPESIANKINNNHKLFLETKPNHDVLKGFTWEKFFMTIKENSSSLS